MSLFPEQKGSHQRPDFPMGNSLILAGLSLRTSLASPFCSAPWTPGVKSIQRIISLVFDILWVSDWRHYRLIRFQQPPHAFQMLAFLLAFFHWRRFHTTQAEIQTLKASFISLHEPTAMRHSRIQHYFVIQWLTNQAPTSLLTPLP